MTACGLCGDGAAPHTTSVVDMDATGGAPVDDAAHDVAACDPCRNAITVPTVGTCLGCGDPIDEPDLRATIHPTPARHMADGAAGLCRECYPRAGAGDLLDEPGGTWWPQVVRGP